MNWVHTMRPQEISNGLILRNACAEDIPALLEHFRAVHGIGALDELRVMLEHYPRFTWEDSFVIVNPESGEIASCVILLQNSWTLEGIQFLTVEMEAVGTLEDYRYRGQIRLLNEAFENRVSEIQPAFQAIAGIPNFYRNFGYEFAANLGGGYSVAPASIPTLPEGEEEPVSFETVTSQNFNEFMQYRETHQARNTWNRTWRRTLHPEDSAYLIFEPSSEEQESFYFYLLKEQNKIVGIFYLARWEKRIDVVELYLDNYRHLDAVLRFASKKSDEWSGIPFRVTPPNQAQVREYLRLRAQVKNINRYAWYIKIPSIPRFIRIMGPLLSKRLNNTEFHEFTGELMITDYKRGYTLSFDSGEFKKITKATDKDPAMYHLRMPWGALTRLLMGYETFDSLASHEPDATCSSFMQPLVRLLFPQLEANVDPYY